MDVNFLTFVVNLVKLGGLGVGALIFVMVFFILMKNQPADPETSKLRRSFLQWGAGFAVVALLASTATQLIPVLRPTAKVRLGVTISPDFAEAKLPPPNLVLMPSGTSIAPNTSVEIAGDTTLTIQVRGIVESVQGLAQSSKSLLATNAQLTSALDKSSQAVESAAAPANSGSAGTVSAAEIPVLRPEELAKMRAAQTQIGASLASGNFRSAAVSSLNLHALTDNAKGLSK